MELYEVMRTTFAARRFTDAPVDDGMLYQILDNARFASSGGNRQGWHVIVVRDAAVKRVLGDLAEPAARRYAAQVAAGEQPWNSIDATVVDDVTVADTGAPPVLTEPLADSPVVLAVCVDLKVVASLDQYLDRVGVISGGSVYPFAWNIQLAARNEGFGTTITTLPVAREPELQALLGIPEHVAVAALMPLGEPVRQLTKLRRGPVEGFATHERFDGAPLTG
ncbi:MAG TPA: nitroreductase family protein [Dehalococcoidia bacterium]|nr:nitroreductase family protein [Dehalococcoidia bacterium]